VQLARIRAVGARPGQEPLDPDRISFTVVLRVSTRSIGEPSSRRLFRDVLDEIWGQPLLTRRPRSKPRERKRTAAFAKACQQLRSSNASDTRLPADFHKANRPPVWSVVSVAEGPGRCRCCSGKGSGRGWGFRKRGRLRGRPGEGICVV
jgi:hypothetical protein